MADTKNALYALFQDSNNPAWMWFPNNSEMLKFADYLVTRGVTAQQWIPVTERLPDSQTDVLLVAFWHERWKTMIGWHSDSGKKWRVITPHGEREPGGVTHWMPLPMPPKEGE